MRARLVTACTWVIVLSAGASGCRLDPIPDPPEPSEGPDPSSRGLDAGAAEGPTTMPDVRLDEAGMPGGQDASRDNRRDAGADVSSDRPPPVDLAPEAAPDVSIIDPLTVGLVAHWRFDEGSGTRTADSTGNGNTATLFNGTAWERTSVPGRPANDFAIRLDGNNDYVSCLAGPMMPRIETSKTISFWFVPDPNAPPIASGSNQRTCVALLDPGPTGGLQVGLDRNRPAAWSWGQGAGFVVSDTVPAAGVRHLAYTFDGNTHRLYLDGALADTSTALPQQGRTSVLYIGTYEPPNELCAGQIDDLRIYNRALPIADITRLSARP